ESLLAAHPEQCLTIPQKNVRSLNLATAAGIVLFEAVRQQYCGER
ncbi:MAG: tRNA (cytidine(34)-2'-O)-methyltransferase, partial [Verrucomicrobiaceae bacterium]